jgi:hypothetical protein
MAEHKVGNTVVLVGTIVEIQGDVALVQVDRSFPSGTTTIAVRLGKLPAAPYDEAHAVERCAICGVVLRSLDAADHPWTGIEPCTSSDEDRIRDAMTEAHNHPGRTITR